MHRQSGEHSRCAEFPSALVGGQGVFPEYPRPDPNGQHHEIARERRGRALKGRSRKAITAANGLQALQLKIRGLAKRSGGSNGNHCGPPPFRSAAFRAENQRWSERQDSNLRRLAPKASALPG